MIKMTLDQWCKSYKPVPNHLDTGHGGDFGKGCCLFETYGDELDYIADLNERDPRCIWTLIEADGELFITEGFHAVDRFGYFVTEKPHNPAEQYEVDYSEYAADHFTVRVKTLEGLSDIHREMLNHRISQAIASFSEALEVDGVSIQNWSVSDIATKTDSPAFDPKKFYENDAVCHYSERKLELEPLSLTYDRGRAEIRACYNPDKGKSSREICTFRLGQDTFAENEAYARLFYASPDMADALEGAAAWFQDSTGAVASDLPEDHPFRPVLYAVAKARGYRYTGLKGE